MKTIPMSAAVSSPSRAVMEAVDALAIRVPELSREVKPDGGVSVAPLNSILEAPLLQLGFSSATSSSFSTRSLSWVAPSRNVAISVHGGRAHTNNDVLVAVLAAAAHRDVDWLIAVLPERYMKTATFAKVADQLQELAQASGIHVDLAGVTLIAF